MAISVFTRSLLLLTIVFHGTISLRIEEVNEDQPVVILSRGAVITPLESVEVFDEIQPVFFLIPDIPEPPSLTDIKCSASVDTRICTIFDESKEALKDVQGALKVTNRILTTKGLKEEYAYEPVNIKPKWFDAVPAVDVFSDSPNLETQQAAGYEYVSDVELKLALRKILETGGAKSLTHRQKRAVIPFLIPAMKFASKIGLVNQLQDFFKGLFTGDNGILSTLAAFRAASPDDRKIFTDLSKKVSEFEVETRKLFVDVLKKTDDVERTIQELQNNHYELSNNMLGFNEMVLMQQSLFSDMTRLMYVSNVYNLHFEAFSDCRSGKISPTFIPVSLLSDKLREIEPQMPADKSLLFSSSEAFRLYKFSIAECIYDSKGGLVKIGIPLRKKQAAFRVFEYKPIQFAHHDYTCSLETPATHVIKDLNSHDVFPITELESDSCEVSSGLCRLPISTDMDTSSICIAILLKGSSADLIKENCKLQCTKRAIPDIAKISDDVYVGIHLPSKGIEIRCPGETIYFSKSLEIGSTRFTLTCTSCKIFWNNRLVGSSSEIPCKEERRPLIESLLPIQFSELKDLKPDGDDGVEKTVFTRSEEVINPQYDPETGSNYPQFNILPTLYTAASVAWDWIQSLAIMYIFYKMEYLPPVAAVAAGVNQMIRPAAGSRTCDPPTDIYIMLWAIIILLICTVVPQLIMQVYKFFRNLYSDSIEVAAVRRERERQQNL